MEPRESEPKKAGGEVTIRAGLARGWLQELANRLAPLLALLALGLFLTLKSPFFATRRNLLTVALQVAPLAIVAMGQTFVIIAGGIDLSVGSVLALSGVVAGLMMTQEVVPLLRSPWSAGLMGAATGGLCGVFNGLVTTRAKMPPFIVTLGMMGIARGLALLLTGGNPIFDLPDSFFTLAQGYLWRIPIPVVLMFALAGLLHFVLAQTRFGRAAYAIGGNYQAARLSGLRVDRYLVSFFGLCGLLTGFAGVVQAARLISAQPATGEMAELDAIAAAVIGGASLLGGQGSIPGTIIGIFIMALLRNGCNLLGVDPYWQQVAIGTMIILAVLYDHLRRRRRR
ncbi:MAG TPA: ABC transporter permease [Armatimonadetes bacterium]|nr:ABC transporter permease [Armatimonadota bacterium]